ncbi:MAG TPA: Fe-S cluster assembly protein SufD [Bacteroidales bacterium]|jgi:Fe-S cluster assembly protein SufD|nr:Fe-S cluster assembly protein SufD [Bacteroidales bacterium]
MNGVTEVTERYLKLYRENIGKVADTSTEYINSFRNDAFEKFVSLGIPTKKNEAYKYTNLNTFFDQDYNSYFIPEKSDFIKAEEFRCDIAELDTYGLVLINGFYPALNGRLQQLPGGVWVGSLNEASVRFPELIRQHYGKYADSNSDGLIHLNTAMASDGVFIYVPENTVLSKPFQIVNLISSEKDMFNQHRNLLIIGKNASATIIICDHTLTPSKALSNAVTEVYAGENAHFDLIRVQNEHNHAGKISHTFLHQEKNSVASSINITLHGGLVRNSTYHYLGGEGAESNVYGLFLADKFQHVDNFVSVDHAFPRCTSNQLFKGVLDDMATAVFNGRILVRPDAQKTLAYQKSNSILLTDDAKMDTKPQLEIFADDVKCSHGAAVGQLDEEALFYLRSRGISRKEARLMLMFGFAHDVLQNIKIEPLRERMDNLVMQRLRGELSRCANCMVKCS